MKRVVKYLARVQINGHCVRTCGAIRWLQYIWELTLISVIKLYSLALSAERTRTETSNVVFLSTASYTTAQHLRWLEWALPSLSSQKERRKVLSFYFHPGYIFSVTQITNRLLLFSSGLIMATFLIVKIFSVKKRKYVCFSECRGNHFTICQKMQCATMESAAKKNTCPKYKQIH